MVFYCFGGLSKDLRTTKGYMSSLRPVRRTQHERSIDPDAPRKTQKGKDETLFFVVTVPCPITLRCMFNVVDVRIACCHFFNADFFFVSAPMWIKCSPAQRVQTVTTCLPRILNVGEAFTTAWTPERIAGLNPKLHYYSNPNSLESPRTPTSKGINKTVYDLTVQSSSHSDGSEETRRGRYVEKEITGKTRKLCNQSAQHMMPNYSCFNTEDFDRKTKARNEQRLDQIKKCVSEKVTVPFLKIHVISNSLMYHKNVPQRRVPCAAEDEKLVPGWEETHSFDFLCIMETQEKHYNATRRLVRRFQFLSSYLIIHEIFRSLPLHFVKTHNLNQILKNFRFVFHTVYLRAILMPHQFCEVSPWLSKQRCDQLIVGNTGMGVGCRCRAKS